MSRLREMIKELCPDGVEYKKLGEVCEILDSQRKPVTKKDRITGPYPYYVMEQMEFKTMLMSSFLMVLFCWLAKMEVW